MQEVRDAWDATAAALRQKMIVASPTTDVPDCDDWPGMAITRSRTVALVASRLVGSGVRPTAPATGPFFPIAELALRDEFHRLRGRVDLIEQTDEGLEVVDFKTGPNQSEISPRQRRQLLLYAVLVRAAFAQWPARLSIENAFGRRASIAVDPGEAENAARDAKWAMDQYNEAISRGRETSLAMAAPSGATCRWCDVKVACAPFWTSLDPDWEGGSVMGQITASARAKRGWTVEIAVQFPAAQAGARAVAYQLPEYDWPNTDGSLAICGAARASNSLYRCRWDTVVAMIDDRGAITILQPAPI